jgi:hypothetical protein
LVVLSTRCSQNLADWTWLDTMSSRMLILGIAKESLWTVYNSCLTILSVVSTLVIVIAAKAK